MDNDKKDKNKEINHDEKIKVERKKSKTKVVISITNKANVRFMPTNKSRIVNQLKLNEKVKLYREIKGKPLLSSDIWYHTDKGYIHSSQAKIVKE